MKILYVIVQDLLVVPKLGIKIREFAAFEKNENDAKQALDIILSLFTHNMQTIGLFDKDIINHLHKIFRGHALS